MKITQVMDILKVLGIIIERNREIGSGPKYIRFLLEVYLKVYDDKDFGRALEACLCLNFNNAPTIEQVELSLAKMEGGIRPLLVDKGIVRPMPKIEEV